MSRQNLFPGMKSVQYAANQKADTAQKKFKNAVKNTPFQMHDEVCFNEYLDRITLFCTNIWQQ